MSEEDAGRVEVLKRELDAAKTTDALLKVARGAIGANPGVVAKGEYSSFKGAKEMPYFSRSSRSGEKEVLIIGRVVEPWKEESITLVLDEETKDTLDGLSYFMGGERKNIEQKEKEGKMIDESWTVDPQDPVTGEAALPMAKAILGGLLG